MTMKTCGELAKHVEPMSLEEKQEFCQKIQISGTAYLNSLITYRPDAPLPKVVRDRLANLGAGGDENE